MRPRFAWIAFYRLGIIPDGTIEIPYGAIRYGAMKKCIAIVGVKADHLRVIGNGVVVIFPFEVSITAARVRGAIGGIELNGRSVVCHGSPVIVFAGICGCTVPQAR